MASMIFNDSTKSSRHGINKLATFCQIKSFSILQDLPLLEIGCWMESDAQLVSSEIPIGVRLGSDQETYSGAKKYLVSHQLCKFSHLKR